MNRKPYPDDLSDKEWEQIEPILKANTYRNAGTRRKYPRREMLNACLVDHLGLLITAAVGAANCSERDGPEALFCLRP